jgi:hypothetical protein
MQKTQEQFSVYLLHPCSRSCLRGEFFDFEYFRSLVSEGIVVNYVFCTMILGNLPEKSLARNANLAAVFRAICR